MSKDIEKLINEAKDLVDKILEAEQNEIPEVPENKKTAGKAVKKEIEGKSNGEAVGEHVDNIMPEVPDTSKTAGKDIKKAISNAINPKVKQPINTQKAKIDNTLPDGVTPDPVQTSANKMKKDIAESIQNFLSKKKSLNENEITLDTLGDYLEDLKKKGFTDKEKLQGMLDKAKAIAAKDGKAGDKKTVVGIFQGFFKTV